MKIKTLNTIDSLRIFGTAIFAMLIGSLISLIFAQNQDLMFYASTIIGQLFIVTSVYIYCKITKVDFIDQINFTPKPKVKHLLISIVIALATLALMFPLQMYFLNFLETLGYKGLDSYMPATDSFISVVMMLFTIAVLPGICEEILFRGAVLRGLYNTRSTVSAILISALLFTLTHGNFSQMLHPFAMGAVIAYVVIKTNSIWCGIIIHFVNNATVLLLDILTPDIYETVYNYGLIFIAVGAVVLVSMLYLITKTSTTQLRKDIPVTSETKELSEIDVLVNKSKKLTSHLITILLAGGALLILILMLIISW